MSLEVFELFRLMPSSFIRIDTVSSGGGSIKTGSYQFSYRLIDDNTGRSSKFSLFTVPITISNSESNGDKSGAINTITDKSIVVSFDVTNTEIGLYNTYQIGVIESNTGSGQSTIVSLSDQIALSSGRNSYKFDSNVYYDRIGIEEVSVDDAAISTFKTIAFKNNKLVGGNIKYKDLPFDNGNPSIYSGSILTKKIPVSGNTDKSNSESRGYFSDELYRFYVSFWDEYGNFSFPYPLNMSGVVGNMAESFNGFKDMKFPKRDRNNKMILTTNFWEEEEEYVETLNKGLRLTLTNIPTWSRGYVITRAVRKKGVLFQSPIIPTTIVQSSDAQNEYPGEGRGAPNPLGTIIPKNMALPLNKAITRVVDGDYSVVEWGANYENFDYCKKIHVAFPPEIIFNNSGVPYVDFVKKEKLSIESVDYCFLSRGFDALLSRDESVPLDDGYVNDGSRSSSACSVASASFDYASDRLLRSEYEAEIVLTDRPITDEVGSISIVPDNISSIPIIGLGSDAPTSEFGKYTDLEITPTGAYNGVTPHNERMVVFTTRSERPDISYYGVQTTKSGYTTDFVISAVNAGDDLVGIQGINIPDVVGQNSNPNYTSAQSFVEIVNFKTSLGDDRYGDKFSQNEIVSTGSVVTYLNSPDFSEVDVFGGDCYISPFTFKVQNSNYAVVNSDKWGDTGKGWGRSFKDSGDTDELRRPYPYKSLSYTIGIFLESEVNSLYGEEFLTKGRDDIYNQISPSVNPWNGTPQKGEFFSYEGKIYRALVNDSTGVTPIESIGYVYEDLNRSLNGSYYHIKSPLDVFYFPKSFTENKTPLLYLYNPEYSIQDRSKPFPVVFSSGKINRVNFSSRLIYSDTGILQTTVEGFNRFRAGNFYDLEESHGSLTKIIDHKGNLYGVQQKAFCYIPFESSVIETADGVALSVQSSQIVGKPNYIEKHGTDYIRTVISTPQGLMFGDFNNSKIVMFEGSVRYLNDLMVSSYIQGFSSTIMGQKPVDSVSQFYYDYSSDDVIFKMNSTALVLGPTNVVKTKLQPGSFWDYGMYNKSSHYLIGNAGEHISLTKINSNSSNKNMLGAPFNSSISFIVNDEGFYTKMFYLVKFIANKPETAIIYAHQNNAIVGSYTATTMQDRWAGYLLNFIRDSSTLKRLRGEYATVVTSVVNNEITTALTKVQAAHRTI